MTLLLELKAALSKLIEVVDILTNSTRQQEVNLEYTKDCLKEVMETLRKVLKEAK